MAASVSFGQQATGELEDSDFGKVGYSLFPEQLNSCTSEVQSFCQLGNFSSLNINYAPLHKLNIQVPRP